MIAAQAVIQPSTPTSVDENSWVPKRKLVAHDAVLASARISNRNLGTRHYRQLAFRFGKPTGEASCPVP